MMVSFYTNKCTKQTIRAYACNANKAQLWESQISDSDDVNSSSSKG